MSLTYRPRNRSYPIGAEVSPAGGVHFRVWAPHLQRVQVEIEQGSGVALVVPLEPEGDGYFAGETPQAQAGTRYRYRLDDHAMPYPDPMSRFQPEGPQGPSEVIDPHSFRWTDDDWCGVAREGQVLYEMHVGTFTKEGTWTAAIEELPALAELGITVIEVMPIGEFPGSFGWSYDGVNLFAPTRLYGRPDDFRQFVNEAHRLRMGVILDVVYNHLGPDGNYLPQFSPYYFSKKYTTDWGKALNFDDEHAGPVREYVLTNAAYWIEEFHLDGLRLDATQDIYDASEEHILAAITKQARRAAGSRSILLVAENEPQRTKLAQPLTEGGYGIDTLWNDDFHHSAMVVLSGRNEAYYSDYVGQPQEFISAAKYGYLYQGQWYTWQKDRRGAPTFGLHPSAFVNFIQNHDQIANSGLGRRSHLIAAPGIHKAVTALLLLSPATPMLFQGQEFSASNPFFYFADHKPEIADLVEKGRKKFLTQFPSLAQPAMQAQLPDPGDPTTFHRCKLDFGERQSHHEAYALHRDLLRLRREDPVFRSPYPGGVDGAVLGDEAFVLRFFGREHPDRLLVVNLGAGLELRPLPEPLMAPPLNCRWQILWSSEDLCYGGSEVPVLDSNQGPWRITGNSALVLIPVPQ